jgi:hypothetical protein
MNMGWLIDNVQDGIGHIITRQQWTKGILKGDGFSASSTVGGAA